MPTNTKTSDVENVLANGNGNWNWVYSDPAHPLPTSAQ